MTGMKLKSKRALIALLPLLVLASLVGVLFLSKMPGQKIVGSKPISIPTQTALPGKNTKPVSSTQNTINIQFGRPEKGVVDGAEVERDQTTGQVRRVRGSVSIPNTKTPRETADEMLRMYLPKFQTDNVAFEDLQLAREQESLTGQHFTYHQYYSGMKLLYGVVSVHLSQDMKVVLVNNDLIPIEHPVPIAPLTDKGHAFKLFREALTDRSGSYYTPTAENVVWVQDGVPESVWEITYVTRAADWKAVINGKDEIRSFEDIAIYN